MLVTYNVQTALYMYKVQNNINHHQPYCADVMHTTSTSIISIYSVSWKENYFYILSF